MAVCPGIHHWTEARDGFVARVRLPGGWLTADQAEALADVAARFGNGAIDLTNRANLQVRGLRHGDEAAFAAAIGAIGLAARTPEADRRRNILADPLRGLDPAEAIDTRALVAALDEALQTAEGLDGLSPKASVVVDGGAGRVIDCPHDVGLVAEDGGYRVSLAGERTISVPADAAVAVVLAALRLMAAEGPGCRMADLDRDAGTVACMVRDAGLRPLLTMMSEEVRRKTSRATSLSPHPEGAAPAAVSKDAGPDIPTPEAFATSSRYPHPSPPRKGERAGPVARQGQRLHWQMVGPLRLRGGRLALGFAVPVARLTPALLAGLARIAATYGDGLLRLTPRQGVVIAGLADGDLAAVEQDALQVGLAVRPPALRIVACAGASGCARGRAETKTDGARLAALPAVSDGPATLHLSGCERGCAHPGEADLVLLARPDGRYDLHEGGTADAPGRRMAAAVTAGEAAAILGAGAPLAPRAAAVHKAG